MANDSKFKKILETFRVSYLSAIQANGHDPATGEHFFKLLLELIQKLAASPFVFQPFHQKVRHPFDYYKFGLDFFRPLIDMPSSRLIGENNLKEIAAHVKAGHNVIFLANHQIEADPLAISLFFEKKHPDLAADIIFVAGERVITDPFAIPFSMGRNLLCIYSKRYIDNPPEEKMNKQLHNKKTMDLMRELLKEGGKCIYVAPSGGRDRRNDQGVVEVAMFDPQSVEMLYLMAKKAATPTFFYPMALATYDVLPPPEAIQIELGEARSTTAGAIHMVIGKVIDMENFPGSEYSDKHARRKARADYIWQLVCSDYAKLTGGS